LPKLKAFYEEVNKEEKFIEIIHCYVDVNEEAHDSHFADMAWPAIPYGNKERVERLEDLCEPNTLPKLTVLNPNGSVRVTDIRHLINVEKELEEVIKDVKNEIEKPVEE
jgi:hypothetical protein